jgi:exopolysaccharide biosynthesis polyprenyl glycosylphosphotransferase
MSLRLEMMPEALVTKAAAPNEARSAASPPRWQRRYVRALIVGDAVVLAAVLGVVVVSQGSAGIGQPLALTNAGVGVVVTLAWLVSLAGARAYDERFLGCGSEEYKRVVTACVHLVGGLGVLALAMRLSLARSFVVPAVMLGALALLVHRFAARRVLYRARERGRSSHRVLVVGDAAGVAALAATVAREPRAGFGIVGSHLVDYGLDAVPDVVRRLDADVVAVTAAPGLTSDRLRQLAWALEGLDVDLIVAPALTDVAGPRVSIRPVAGLPLLHVDQPDITGVRYLLKECVERAVAAAVLLVSVPVMAALAAAVKLTSPGPVFFSQTRVSRLGREFQIYKFRTMRADAETLLETLQEQNAHQTGPLFKMRQDPRVTRVGRFLRRYSLDELPQLLNVLRGDMALVGPRPPLPVEVASYRDDAQRRLLVKPGMTGLWQVSGRSDLSWEESVRLDLYYVENWSLALDAQILVRTARAVLRGAGAY